MERGGRPYFTLTLTVNFRSTRPVVDWVNATFAQVLPPRDDLEDGP